MILIDYSQLAVACACVVPPTGTRDSSTKCKECIIRSLVHTRSIHSSKYGHEATLCCDNGSWRNSVFPAYKWKRRHEPSRSGVDWTIAGPIIEQAAIDLHDHFGFRRVSVPNAEGDDVIAVLAKHLATGSSGMLFGGDASDFKTLIVSADKDMTQLLDVADVYDHRKNRHVTGDANTMLKEMIIKGDSADSIPNILNGPDSIMNKAKQVPMTKGRLKTYMEMSVEDIKKTSPELSQAWCRNEHLISLRGQTPPMIASDIIRQYEDQTGVKAEGILEYLYQNRMFPLLADAQSLL